MPFNINDFSSEINAKGFNKTSLYDVTFFGPNSDLDTERSINMRCISAEVPGRQVDTSHFSYYGPQRRFATNSVFVEWNCQILVSEDLSEREYFEKWMDKIMGNYRLGTPNPTMYDLGFYDDYVGTIEISNYNEVGEEVKLTRLIEAWPININNIQLHWASGDDLMVLPVTFAFKYYTNPD